MEMGGCGERNSICKPYLDGVLLQCDFGLSGGNRVQQVLGLLLSA